MNTSKLLVGVTLVGAVACSESSEPNGLAPGPVPPPVEVQKLGAALVAVESNCEDVGAAIRRAATRGMEQLLERQLEDARKRLAAGSCSLSGGWGYGGSWGIGISVPTAAAPEAAPAEVSETNNQVSGVDEADIIKNDDRYIYAVAQGALQIVEAWPAATARVIAKVPLPDQPKRLLVSNDRLLVFSSVKRPADDTAAYAPWAQDPQSECTYGYDCDFTGDGNGTRLTLFDITDRAAPTVVRTLETRGSFLSARRIGSVAHTAFYEEPEYLRTLVLSPPELYTTSLCDASGGVAPDAVERVELAYEALRMANVEAIQNAPLHDLVSDFTDSAASGVQRDCSGYYDSPLADGAAYLSLVSFDLDAPTPLHRSTVLSRPGASYASLDAYYFSVRQSPLGNVWYDGLTVNEASTVHKFTLDGAANRYAASGVVPGRVLNQFSLDEHDGHLRIATTTGHLPSPDVQSALTVLRQDGDALEVVGSVDGIAPSEDIRSVRFVGDQAYIVTFKKTDPLFVFDLSDPASPRIRAELKIPGFSTYMHPFADGHLLTIGYDAADQGDFAFFTGLLLQVFDVRDPAKPALRHKEVIGTRGSTSDAATNHLAFNYFAPRSTLALPVTVCEGGGDGGQFGTTMSFSGVRFYNVTADSGFSLTGAVSHPYVDPAGQGDTYYVGGACSNWWTQARSIVHRTVFMDDFVYSVSDLRIKVSDLRDLSRDVADVAF